MKTIFVGGDVSKGYVDFEFVNEAGSCLEPGARFDDTPQGHRIMRKLIAEMSRKHGPLSFVVGLESSGGLERNWLKLFRDLRNSFPIEVLLLNPLAVKKYLERDLHRNVNDRISARGIAQYLRVARRPQEVEFEPQMEGPRTLYRCLANAIGRRAEIQCELQSLLPRVQPNLVQFCRDGLPEWVLQVLISYPLASSLARARKAKLIQIPYVTAERAEALIAQAEESVASQSDQQTADTVRFLAEEITRNNENIEQLKADLCESMKTDQAVQIMDSIPGIGLWTAMCLRLEFGNFERFYSADAAVAFAGLDPRVHQSGDSEHHLGISHRGRKQIRAALYMPTLAAIRTNPIIRDFYVRLLASGKPELVCIVACMRKLILLAYACCITEKTFDPDYAKKKLSNSQPKSSIVSSKSKQLSLKAPVSRREAKKRKAAALPQNGYHSFKRGPGAASINSNPSDQNG